MMPDIIFTQKYLKTFNNWGDVDRQAEMSPLNGEHWHHQPKAKLTLVYAASVKFLILGTGTSRNKILKGSQNQIWRCSLDGSRDENQPLDGRQEQTKQGERWGKRGEWRVDRSKAVETPER
jgi:hypothetical protein